MDIGDLLGPRLQHVFFEEITKLGVGNDENRIVLFGCEDDKHVVWVRYSVPVCGITHASLEAACESDHWGGIDNAVKAAAALVVRELERAPETIVCGE